MLTIRKATNDDICDIVRIHMDAFKTFFLTSLGHQFLMFYYSCFIRNKDSVVLVAIEGKQILGFSAATSICKGFNARLIKENFLSFFWLSVKLLFSNPKALFRLVKNIVKKSDVVNDDEDYAELYSIGVAPDGQGMGIGKRLLKETEDALLSMNVERISLTTDFYNNEKTIGFYRGMGYEVLYEFIAYPNRKMYRFIKRIK